MWFSRSSRAPATWKCASTANSPNAASSPPSTSRSPAPATTTASIIPDEFLKVVDLRKQLAQQPIGDAIETLLTNLRATKTNAELLLRGLR